MHDTDIMEEWIDLGDRADNPYVTFMAYWVAFNMVYAPYRIVKDENGNVVRDEKGKPVWRNEFEAIIKCFEVNQSSFKGYDPFAKGDVDAFSDDSLCGLFHKRMDIVKRYYTIQGDNTENLMKAVYRVRCNFFHGNKKLGDVTDEVFVRAGAKIVRGYLSSLGIVPMKDE